MSEPFRILPEDVLAAYASTGLKPARGKYVNDRATQACGVGCFAVAHGAKADNNAVHEWVVNQDNRPYFFGFVHGFDELVEGEGYTKDSLYGEIGQANYDRGYKDGQTAAAVVFGGVSP